MQLELLKDERNIHTDLMTLTEHKNIEEIYSFYIVKDCTEKDITKYNSSTFYKNCSVKLASDINIRGVVPFKFGYNQMNNRGLYIFLDNSLEQDGYVQKIEKDYSLYDEKPLATFEKISFKDIPEEKRAQLLLSAVNYINDENYQYTNDLWELLVPVEIDDAKNVCIKFVFKNDNDLGLYLKADVLTFTNYNEEYHANQPIYIFDKQVISRYNGQKEGRKLVKKAFPNSKQSIKFIDFQLPVNNPDGKNKEKIADQYSNSKAGVFAQVIKDFNEMYDGYLSIEQKEVPVTFLKSNYKKAESSREEGLQKLKELIPKIYIDYDDSIRDYSDVATIVKKTIINMEKKDGYNEEDIIIQKGISENKDVPVLRIVATPEIYEKAKVEDSYNLIDKAQLNVQHLNTKINPNKPSLDTENTELDKNPIRSAVTGLAIQMSVQNNKIDIFNNLDKFKGYTFFLPVLKVVEENNENDSNAENNKNKEKKRKEWTLDKVGFLHIGENKETFYITAEELLDAYILGGEDKRIKASLLDLYELLIKDETTDKNENKQPSFERFTYGVIKPDGHMFLVKPTDIGTQVDLLEFDNYYLNIYDKNLNKGDKVKGFRTNDNMYKLMPGLLHSAYFKTDEAYYYYSATWREALNSSIDKKPVLYKIPDPTLTDEDVADLIRLMDTPFAHNGNLSIVPYPIKVLRTIF